MGTQRDTAEYASSGRFLIISNVNEVPVLLFGVAENEQGLGMVVEQLVHYQPLGGE